MPSAMKITPAPRRSQRGETKRLTPSPTPTAIAELTVRASALATKTSHFVFEPAESESVASCVLSPSSATKMATNVDKKSFQAIEAEHSARLAGPRARSGDQR